MGMGGEGCTRRSILRATIRGITHNSFHNFYRHLVGPAAFSAFPRYGKIIQGRIFPSNDQLLCATNRCVPKLEN